jgi:hypothetical protein
MEVPARNGRDFFYTALTNRSHNRWSIQGKNSSSGHHQTEAVLAFLIEFGTFAEAMSMLPAATAQKAAAHQR